MDWIEQMKEAMMMVKTACAQNTQWADCDVCPFREQCDAFEQNGMIDIPAAWKI